MEGCGESDLLEVIVVLIFPSCKEFTSIFFYLFPFFNALICTDEVKQNHDRLELELLPWLGFILFLD